MINREKMLGQPHHCRPSPVAAIKYPKTAPIRGYGLGQASLVAQPVGTFILAPPRTVPRVTEFLKWLYVSHPIPVTNLTKLPSESMNCSRCVTRCLQRPFHYLQSLRASLSNVNVSLSRVVVSRVVVSRVVMSRCRTIIHLHTEKDMDTIELLNDDIRMPVRP